MNKLFLTIEGENGCCKPIVEEGITWETERKGTPGKLTFNVVKDSKLNFQEGNKVSLEYNNTCVFRGFIFNKKRNKDQLISVTAYDQLRYLKNKDTYKYEDKTASDIIKMIIADVHLNAGAIENTGYILAKRRETNKTYFDIIQQALDLTLINTKKMYVLYDNGGEICLKNIESMKVDLVIGVDSAEDFDYETSIDKNTYNQVKLSYDNKDTEKIADGRFKLSCETDGEAGNRYFGVLIPIEYIKNLATAELTELLIPGEDEESDDSLRERYFDSFENQAYGGIDSNGNVIPTTGKETALKNMLLKKPIDGYTYPVQTTARYTLTLSESELANEYISEQGLFDSEGALVAYKTFLKKGKDGDMKFQFDMDEIL